MISNNVRVSTRITGEDSFFCVETVVNGQEMDCPINVIAIKEGEIIAWQDPTHVRAFNEKSWLYYTDWSWYLGWKDRFYLQSMEFELSDIGVKMAQEEGLDINQLSVVPRAIDAMRIVLTKKP